ncbi:MAG: hypothetical protein JWP27_2139 [Flaviaesturariibacter sp.]|nr:hypothetical protein [Flaviaesturariibacter sp.]
MVVIRIIGGLGNQLFQYAAARSLAATLSTDLKVDVTALEAQDLRHFDLQSLHPLVQVAAKAEIDQLKPSRRLARIVERLKPVGSKRFYKEPFFHFDPALFTLSSPVYLQGYFQSELYFKPIEDDIRQIYSFPPHMVETVRGFADQLNTGSSVSVHIRRGDYKNPVTQKIHGILTPAYYQAAIAKIHACVSDPVFYVFTDDSAWVRANLDLPDAHLISGTISQTHFEDLYLMSKCNHHIIANSSFSWWGAWLNKRPDKTVVAPASWFNEGPSDTQDLLPPGWVRV